MAVHASKGDKCTNERAASAPAMQMLQFSRGRPAVSSYLFSLRHLLGRAFVVRRLAVVFPQFLHHRVYAEISLPRDAESRRKWLVPQPLGRMPAVPQVLAAWEPVSTNSV